MGRTQPRAAASTALAAAGDIQLATPAHTLAQPRETGWPLNQLTGGLAYLAALLVKHTSHHTTHPDPAREIDGGDPGEPRTRAVPS